MKTPLKKIASILTLLLFVNTFLPAQISGDLVGTTVISGQTQFVKINPNTGFVTVIGNQTAPIYGSSFINLGSAAYDCVNNNYVFCANYNSQDVLLTINKTSGSIIASFGYPIIGLTFNQNNGRYYGLEYVSFSPIAYKLVSFDPVLGTKTTISTSTISGISQLGYRDGYTLDLNNNKYTFLYTTGVSSPIQKIFSIDIISGAVVSNSVNYGPNISEPLMAIVHNNSNNMTYGYARYGTSSTDSIYFCSITNSGQLTKIAHIPQHLYGFPNGANNPSSGAALNTISGVYSYVDYQKKVVSININTGAVLASPQLSSTDIVSYIQYANCNAVSIEEYSNQSASNFIFPNPVENKTIFLNRSVLKKELATIKIFNTFGQVAFSLNISDVDDSYKLSVDDLPSGLYFIEYTSGTKTFRNSLIIK